LTKEETFQNKIFQEAETRGALDTKLNSIILVNLKFFSWMCVIQQSTRGVWSINLQRRLAKVATIPPYIPWDGFRFTDERMDYCKRESGSLGRTITRVIYSCRIRRIKI